MTLGTIAHPPGSSVQGILQARIVEWVAISFSRVSSHPGIKPGSPALQQTLYYLGHQGNPLVKEYTEKKWENMMSETVNMRTGVKMWGR